MFVRDGPQSARIGSIQQDPNLPAQVNVDDLLGKHFAVLGATGTGKSCAVTLILKAILKQQPERPHPAARPAQRICPRPSARRPT